MVSVKHKFQSAKADSNDGSLVRPSNWNDEHNITMASGRLLGRTAAGTGPVGELTVSEDFTLSGGQLALGPNVITGKANKATLVSEQPIIPPASLVGNTYMAIYNVGADADGRILLADFAAGAGFVKNTTKVIGSAGLHNRGNKQTLNEDITIDMVMPGTLSASTVNAAAASASHTHQIECASVAMIGCAAMDEASLGSTGFMYYLGGGSRQPGEEVSGSNLRWSSASSNTGASPTGTWMVHGTSNATTADEDDRRSVYQKISNSTALATNAEFRNPRYNENNTIDVEIFYPSKGKWLPATLAHDDPEPWYADLFLIVMNAGGVAPYVQPTPAERRAAMPSVTLRQLRLILLHAGITSDKIDYAINRLPASDRELAKIDFYYSMKLRRTGGAVSAVLKMLGYGEREQDELWEEAKAVTL